MLAWFSDLGNSKVAALLVFFPLFIAIVVYVYSNRNRSEKLESYKFMPLQDDDELQHDAEQGNGNSK